MSAPSFRAAVDLARPVLAAEGRDAANALMARLLWLVEAEDGGFMGLSDRQLQDYCKRLGLDEKAVNDAAWAPGNWPALEGEAA